MEGPSEPCLLVSFLQPGDNITVDVVQLVNPQYSGRLPRHKWAHAEIVALQDGICRFRYHKDRRLFEEISLSEFSLYKIPPETAALLQRRRKLHASSSQVQAQRSKVPPDDRRIPVKATPQPPTFVKGDWVEVLSRDGRWFPGQVLGLPKDPKKGDLVIALVPQGSRTTVLFKHIRLMGRSASPRQPPDIVSCVTPRFLCNYILTFLTR